MRSSFITILALVAFACVSLPAAAHFQDHPLSKVHVENIAQKMDGGVITIDAPILNGTGSTVTVSWSGMSSVFPGDFDWIGVWSPKPDDYTTTTPAKYKYVIPDASGAGSTQLWLVNMRASYVVAYFTGGLIKPTLLAESAPVEFSNYHIPLQIHLAYTSDPTQMRVDWNSMQSSSPHVTWGTEPSNLNNVITQVETDVLTADELCGAPGTTKGWHDSGYLHSALIQSLTPNTQYYYQVGDATADSMSDVLTFFSAPDPSTTELDFIIFGDLGQVETDGSNEASQMDGSILTTVAMAKDFADGSIALNRSAAVFHIGDISYARGYETLWEQFFYQLSPMSPFVPWMTVDGNHERDFPGSGSVWTGTDSGGECGVVLSHRFHNPIPDPTQPDQSWWSLNYGPMHITVISTEHSFNESSPQYEWVAADWAAVNRTATPWLILAGHRPMYIDSTNDSPGGGDTSVGDLLIASFEPLMKQYAVDAAFWGHHHSYQRTCPVFNKTCVEGGVVHIVTGAAGAGFSTNVQTPTPKWIEYVETDTHGYVRAFIRGNSLELLFINANNRQIMDQVTLQSRFPSDIKSDVEPETVAIM